MQCLHWCVFFFNFCCKMSQVQMKKKGGVRRVMSHREGAPLRGLMFPGPFQFFRPGTQTDRDVSVNTVDINEVVSLSRHTQAQHRLHNSINSFNSTGTTAALWKEVKEKNIDLFMRIITIVTHIYLHKMAKFHCNYSWWIINISLLIFYNANFKHPLSGQCEG